MRRPNLFIVGAPRCGTTSLHYYLGQHPEIFMSQQKEPHYFGRDLIKRDRRFPRSEAAYLALFREATSEKWLGESSTYYLYSSSAPEEIFAFEPKARIIIALRHPVDFVRSLHARQLFWAHESEPSLERALAKEEARKQGRDLPRTIGLNQMVFYTDYVMRLPQQVKAYLARFGPERVEVLLFDDLRRDPLEVYRKVLAFLGVEPSFMPDLTPQNGNQMARSRLLNYVLRTTGGQLKAIKRRFIDTKEPMRISKWVERLNIAEAPRQGMDPHLRDRLLRQFAPVVDSLSEVLQRDLAAWRLPGPDSVSLPRTDHAPIETPLPA